MSISINKYMHKAGEPENDAGFLKHYSPYHLKPRLVVTVFRLHIYGSSKWLLTRLTHAHTATVRVSSRALVMPI